MIVTLRALKELKIPRWMIRRSVFMVLVVLVAILINFLIPRLMPGDYTTLYVSTDMSPEVMQAELQRLGLDRPMWDQFLIYLKNTFTLDFGTSFYFKTTSVSSMIAARLPRTLILLIPGELFGFIIGYFVGVNSGWKAGSKQDSSLITFGLIFWSMPMFWLAMLLLWLFGYTLRWFPLSGFQTIGASYGFWGTIWDRIYHLILPWIAMASKFGAHSLVMRNTMTITLKQNYIMTAKSKGLREYRVKQRHAARNALLPMITGTALRFATSIAGLIFIEQVFNYPGMGKMIFDAVSHQDYPVLQASFLILSLTVVITMFLLDIVYARLDPRIRYE